MRFIHGRLSAIVIITAIFLSPLGARGVDDSEVKDLSDRIVQTGPSAFIVENALYLFPEAQNRVVALADGDQGGGFFVGDLDPLINEKTVLPRRATTEEVLAQNPDIVVMKNFLKRSMGEPLERVGVPVVYLNLETPEFWMAELDLLGELFANPRRAEELKGIFERRISSVTEPLEVLADDDKPTVLFLYWSIKDGVSAVNIPPVSWIQTRMVEMSGGVPVWRNADLDERWTRTNVEQIALWNPDHIVVAAYHMDASAAVNSMLEDPIWSSLTAVKEGRVHAFPSDYHSWDQPDARWLLGLAWLAGELHPGFFDSLNMKNESRSFYREMYGMDDEKYNELILPRLTGLD
ncbi:MAG: ABC transporter substrate-binding protein [Spirochaetaceae bacterium]|nr:ABC transporter substrate-binding protein [Spirochaetaceae bacterium]MDT8297890.1 ABC transporter substrate-binding protein [Spirochaetaceae bacterium]